MPITQDATIVWARGHLHMGGEKVDLAVNGKVVCSSKATYDANGVIETMSLCPKPIPVKKGDYMTVSSLYDVAAHPL
jgi:hypothetical protein